MPRPLKNWLPVVLWMTVIFVMSTDLGSGEHTSRIIGPLLRWLNPQISPEALASAQMLVRKAGHLTEYGILALLVRRAVSAAPRTASGAGHGRAAGIALLVATAYAATDEFHQSFVPSRGASPTDVLIDATGALLALAAAMLWKRWRQPAAKRA